MNKARIILLGAITALPLGYLIFMFSVSFLYSLSYGGIRFQSELMPVISSIVWFADVVLIIYYIVNVFRSQYLERDYRTLWTILIFFGSPIAMPVYWYKYILQKPNHLAVQKSTTNTEKIIEQHVISEVRIIGKRKSSVLAGVLNLWPGVGYLYVGDRVPFAVLLFAVIPAAMIASVVDPSLMADSQSASSTSPSPLATLVIFTPIITAFVVDAYLDAKKYNSRIVSETR